MSTDFLQYSFDPQLLQLGIHTIIAAEIKGIDNTRPLTGQQRKDLEIIAQQIIDTDEQTLSMSPVLQGYLQCLAQINRSAKKFPPSALALSHIVRRAGRLPSINPVVDLYNGAALQSKLSLGVHDIAKLCGRISFRFSQSQERFIPIGGGEKITQPGDYLYSDEQTVLAWLDARDSELVKVTENTKDLLIVAQGNPETSVEMRYDVLHDLCRKITEHCGGSYQLLAIHKDGSTVI